MTTHLTDPLPRDADVARRLNREFAHVLPAEEIAATLAGAERDLTGQIVPEAWDEMVYRLTRYRLDGIAHDVDAS